MKNNPWQMIRPTQDTLLAWTLCISIILHAMVLAIEFKYPGTIRTFSNRALDVILVNSRSEEAPDDPQAAAQQNLDAGGKVDEPIRAQSPLPPEFKQKEGAEADLIKQNKAEEYTPQPRQVIAVKEKQSEIVAVEPVKETKLAEAESALLSGEDLLNRTRKMLQLEAEINRKTIEYNQRPVKVNIGARTQEDRFAYYIESWRDKIERIGTINFPEKSRNKLYGTLIMTVTLRQDGSVDEIEIERSSGSKDLDDAALRIVRLAEPFAEFPPNIRDTDLLGITRTWTFTSKNELETRW